MWIKGPHPRARGRKALDDDLRARTGQSVVPASELADGHAHRAESREMAARIDAGRLFAS